MTIFAKNRAFNEKLREGRTPKVNFSLNTAAYESSDSKWENYRKIKPFLEPESQEFIEEEFKEQDNTFPGIEGQVSGIAEGLTPGPLRDELLGSYDPSQETYEEWLQRIGLGERPFNMNEGGRIGFAEGPVSWNDLPPPGAVFQRELTEREVQALKNLGTGGLKTLSNLAKDILPGWGEVRSKGYADEEIAVMKKAIEEKDFPTAIASGATGAVATAGAMPWWTGVGIPIGLGGRLALKGIRGTKQLTNYLSSLREGKSIVPGRGSTRTKFSTEEVKTPLDPALDTLDENKLTAFVKEKIENKHFNDLNFYKAFEKYKDLYHGGNLAKAEKTILEGSGKGTDLIRGHARERNYKFQTMGRGEKASLAGDAPVWSTVKEFTDELVSNPKLIDETLPAGFNTDQYLKMKDIGRLLGMGKGDKNLETFRKAMRSFQNIKKGAYSVDKAYATNLAVRSKAHPGRDQLKLYHVGDILENLKNYALKSGPGGSPKTIIGTYKGSLTSDARKKFVNAFDAELFQLQQKFYNYRHQGLYTHGDPSIIQLAKSGKFKKTRGKYEPLYGVNKDWGHGFHVDFNSKFNFINKSKANQEKLYALNKMTLQDAQINQEVLANFWSKEKGAFAKVEDFFTKNAGKKWNSIDKQQVKDINTELYNIYKGKRKAVKEFIADKPFLKGQENTLVGLKLTMKPGKTISIDDIKVDTEFFNPGKFSLGRIDKYNSNAIRLDDLGPTQKKRFKETIFEQEKQNLKEAAKKGDIDKETIDEIIEDMDFGFGESRKGYVSDEGELTFAGGGRVGLADGTTTANSPGMFGKFAKQIAGIPGVKQTGSVLGRSMDVLGSPLASATYIALDTMMEMEEGKSWDEIAMDPEKGAAMLLPSTYAQLAKLMGSPQMRGILTLWRAGKLMTPTGLIWAGSSLLYQGGQEVLEEINRRSNLTPEQLELENEQRALEQNAKTTDMYSHLDEDYLPEETQTPIEIDKPKYQRMAEGGIMQAGRMGFAKGPSDPGRRNFIKIFGGLLAAIPLAKWLKFGPKAKQLSFEVMKHVKGIGMPKWFPDLVNRVVKEGTDVSKRLGTVEREVVHTKKIGTGKYGDEEVTVYQNLDTGSVRVEYGGPVFNKEGQVVRASNEPDVVYLEYRAPEEVVTKKGSVKTKSEFSAAESEPEVVNWDGDIEFSGINEVNKVEDLVTDTSKLEEFATKKKLNIKGRLRAERKQKARAKLESDTMEQVDYIENKYGPGHDPSDAGSIDEHGNLLDEFGEIID